MPRGELKTHDIPADTLKGLTRCVMSTSKGDITIEMFPDAAPNTVANFYVLAKDGFYDGLNFHRVIPASSPRAAALGHRHRGPRLAHRL